MFLQSWSNLFYQHFLWFDFSGQLLLLSTCMWIDKRANTLDFIHRIHGDSKSNLEAFIVAELFCIKSVLKILGKVLQFTNKQFQGRNLEFFRAWGSFLPNGQFDKHFLYDTYKKDLAGKNFGLLSLRCC